MTTARRNRTLLDRYPTEGASDSLCHDLGMPAWKIRYYANNVLKLKVDPGVKRAKAQLYTTGQHR